MDVILLSRLQFAAAVMFHFLFVPLTLGLSIIIAVMESKYAKTGDMEYLKMTKFWGKIFIINFALGVVTGITLEFQFGTNWARYSAYVGDIFGSLLAIEATAAFFLESTLIGVWIFGWKKLSKKAHATVMWFIAFATNLSAVWILTANAWMQHPVGYVIRNGRAELVDFFSVITQKFAILEILHTIPSGYILSSFFVMGVSAYHLLKKRNVKFFTKSFNIALILGLISSLFVAAEGDLHGKDVVKTQPEKFAAMESFWETQSKAPIYLFSIPDEKNEKNKIEIGKIPGLLSILAFGDINAEVKGLKEFPKNERPPVFLTSFAFKGMVGLGVYFIIMTFTGFIKRKKLTESPIYLKLMLFSIPLPYLALQLGWIVAEVGRQPWIVYKILKTSEAASTNIASMQVFISFIGFIALYGLLGITGFYLIYKNSIKSPDNI